jgi:hypothetical protein
MTNSVSWQDLYTTAMLELDRTMLQGTIEAAQTDLRQAMKELSGDHKVEAEEEMQTMADAVRNLQTLQRVEFTISTPAAPDDSQGRPLATGYQL